MAMSKFVILGNLPNKPGFVLGAVVCVPNVRQIKLFNMSLYMLHFQLQIRSFRFSVRRSYKFFCWSSSVHRMNKRKIPQRLKKSIQLTTPTKTIKVKQKSKLKTNSRIEENGGMIPMVSKSPSLLFSGKWAVLSPDFFQIDALDLAPRLLGKFLKKDDVVLQITEVEAYRPNDSACHARFGITSRTAPVFGPGGHTYVYLCYGLHTMLNIVADKEGVGAAVLIRSCAPVSGLETIQQRRGLKTEKPVLLTGPGKVGQALGISTEWSNHPLFTPGGLELLDGPEPEKILVGPRVGIEYALPEHVNALWRFAMADTPWISAPKNTLIAP